MRIIQWLKKIMRQLRHFKNWVLVDTRELLLKLDNGYMGTTWYSVFLRLFIFMTKIFGKRFCDREKESACRRM